jgi:nitrate reductase NapD
MNISSIVVHTHPQESSALQGRLAGLPGVDIHAATDDGRIIITIEDTPTSAPSETLMNVQNMQGVLSAAMVYNYSDEQLTPTQE